MKPLIMKCRLSTFLLVDARNGSCRYILLFFYVHHGFCDTKNGENREMELFHF